eukprot:4735444-Prymnesium_polylepis.2
MSLMLRRALVRPQGPKQHRWPTRPLPINSWQLGCAAQLILLSDAARRRPTHCNLDFRFVDTVPSSASLRGLL